MLTYMKRAWSSFIRCMLPVKVKRMVVLSSLTNDMLKRLPVEDRERAIALMNVRFKFCMDIDAMKFSIELGKLLWKDLKARYSEVNKNYDELVIELYNCCPDSLRYTDENTMKKDIREMIVFIEKYGKANMI